MAGALPTELRELLKNKVIELSSYVTKVLHPVFVVIITSSAPKITTFRHQNPNWDLNHIENRTKYLWVFPSHIYWGFIITIQNAYRRRQFSWKSNLHSVLLNLQQSMEKWNSMSSMSSALISTRSTSGLPLKGDVERYIVHMLDIDNYLFQFPIIRCRMVTNIQGTKIILGKKDDWLQLSTWFVDNANIKKPKMSFWWRIHHCFS